MPDRELQEQISKSERKRQMLALQKLGVQLLKLSAKEWQQLALPDTLQEALELAQRIKNPEGKRRQLQYIGKLMRQIDAEPVEEYLRLREAGHQHKVRRFQALEQLRDDLIEARVSPEQVIVDYPQAERSQLGQLLRTARKERERQQSPRAARKLFRYLRELDELRQHEAAIDAPDSPE
jgi:ribosome-associated protein